MEPIQPGSAFLFALIFVFVFCPAAVWAGYHYMHVLEEHDHDEGEEGGGH